MFEHAMGAISVGWNKYCFYIQGDVAMKKQRTKTQDQS